MVKFNKPNKVEDEILNHPDLTVNEELGVAFQATPKTELTLRALTWLVNEPKFYEQPTENQDINELIGKVATEDPEYILKLALYARNQMYLRSAPIYLLVQAANQVPAKQYVNKYTPYIVNRADELTESIALYIATNGGKSKLPNSLKKGLAKAIHKFNRYQFAKYNRKGAVKLRDVLRLVHPKPRNDKESETFKMILEDNLPTPETWEVNISTKGATKESWTEIIPKMGYMAMLRNLRNFLKHDVDITPVIAKLTNPEAVATSKQFPFRFLSAYKVLERETEGDRFKRQQLMQAVSEALELSTANLPKWKGKTFVTCDNSGSMESKISGKSTMQRIEVGNIMGALAFRNSDAAIASNFGQTFNVLNINPKDTVMANTQKLIRNHVGHSTNGFLAIKWLNETKTFVDRIMVFSDEQLYDSTGYAYASYGGYGGTSWGNNSIAKELKIYKRTVNPKVFLYSFDLAGYGTLQFPEDEPRVCNVAGFSEKIFDFVNNFESFGKGLIDTIDKIQVE